MAAPRPDDPRLDDPGADDPGANFLARRERAARLPLLDVDPGDPRAVAAVRRYVAELDRLFEGGFDPGPGPLADTGGWFTLILDRDALGGDGSGGDGGRGDDGGRDESGRQGRQAAATVVACGGLRRLDRERAEIKRMWVDPVWRGAGLAGRLLRHLEQTAVHHGFTEVVLDTAAELAGAQALYTRSGYRAVPAYNDNPYARHWFAKRLDADGVPPR